MRPVFRFKDIILYTAANTLGIMQLSKVVPIGSNFHTARVIFLLFFYS
jgi:hypothetical protein